MKISKLKGDELKAFRYSMRFRYIDERQLAIDCAVEEATEAAIVQGIKQGVKRGAKLSLLKTAKNMLARGFSIADIIRATDLSREQIKALKLS
jgi:predicted transposase/invertase (TIGR01784 family)